MGGGECGRGIPMKYRNCSFRNRWTFSLFFCIFSYSESPLAWIFGSQGVSDPFLGGYEGWFVRTLRGSPKKSKCLKKIGVLPPPRGGGGKGPCYFGLNRFFLKKGVK